tara:strand:- start:2016 stop:2210 length:195 start_codon:yes stop_codon:yes gene_type:complete
MSKEKKELTLKEKSQAEMEVLVEQHNELANQIQEANARLSEVKSMILEKQGYLKALIDCEEECK